MDAVQLRDVDGFGIFPSGLALATKFSQKAAGGDVYSMTQALEDHIATVTEMRDAARPGSPSWSRSTECHQPPKSSVPRRNQSHIGRVQDNSTVMQTTVTQKDGP